MSAPLILVNKILRKALVSTASTSEEGFPIDSLVTDSPSDIVRTGQANAKVTYTFDAGEGKKFTVDQYALANINYRTGIFQMSDTDVTDSWSSGVAAVHNTFTTENMISGTITAVDTDRLTDNAQSFRLNQFARPGQPLNIVITSGSANGKIYRIIGNNSDTLFTDETFVSTDGVAVDDTFVISRDQVTRQISSAAHRYVRLVIDSQNTPEQYYITGKTEFGEKIQLSKNFDSKFNVSIVPNNNLNVSRAGQIFSVKKGESKRIFSIAFTLKTSALTNEIEDMFDAIDWGNKSFIFTKDSANLQDFFVARVNRTKIYSRSHLIVDINNINSLIIEEEV